MALKILVVDDDESVRQTVRCVLGPIGEILEASSGAQALRLIESNRPRLILADVSMPGMDGLALLAAAHRIAPSAIIVMLTAERDVAVAKTALADGARAYVTKPFDIQSLRAQVRDLLGLFEPGQAPVPYRPWRVAC